MSKIEEKQETAQETLENLRKKAKVPGTYRAIVSPVGREGDQIIYEIKEKAKGLILGTVKAPGYFHLSEAIRKFETENNMKIIYDYHGKVCGPNFENRTIKLGCKSCEGES